jgi:SAM-dependent methyltransferase
MRRDRIKWNKKYDTDYHPVDVADVVKRFYSLAPGKKALDIAAGNGRNAVFLSQKGFSVDAVDISEVGLATFAGKYKNINAVCVDLDHFDIHPAHYDLIINIKFLNRRLFPFIQEGLKAGGVVIFHTLLESVDGAMTHDHCREYLLRRNELLHAFIAMRVIYYHEGEDSESDRSENIATLVALKI